MRAMFTVILMVGVCWAGPSLSRADEQGKKADPTKAAKSSETKADTAKTAPGKSADAKTPAKKKVSVVRLTISGALPEGPTAPGIFGEMQVTLGTVIERLQQAAEDKNVGAIWLRIEDVAIGRGKLNELRGAIARARKSGKPVIAELAGAEPAQYLIAAACDKIYMAPGGALILPGVRAEVTFFKGMLDKIGVEFDYLQMGKFKGAAEPMTRTGMSEPFRENLTSIVDCLYDQLATTIAADRKLKDYQVKVLIDQGVFSAAAAQKAKLVDQLAYADQIQDALQKQLKADEINLLTNYKKKQVDMDFSGIGGMMKLMDLLMGGKPSDAASKNKRIAVVYAVGPIVEGKGEQGPFGGENMVASTPMVATLRKVADDPKVVAVVLRIDSPGGSAIASDLIWRETIRMKKPIIASMGDVAGSGGYYIAMGTNKIIAEPGTITGSIGVIGGKIVLKGLYDKVGLSTDVISRGEMAGAMSSTDKFSPAERKAMQGLMQDIYQQFVGKAAQGRKMPRNKLESLAQGRIYTGAQAIENGLVDKLGTLADAIAEAKTAAGLKADEKIDIQILPQQKSFFEQLLGGDDISGEVRLATATLGLPELDAFARQAKFLKQLFTERTLLWMPYDVRLK